MLPGLYANGWIKRGPVGLIGATKSDAIETIAVLIEDLEAGALPTAPERDGDAILRLLEDRYVQYTTWDGRMALDEHEKALGAPPWTPTASPAPGSRLSSARRWSASPVTLANQPSHA